LAGYGVWTAKDPGEALALAETVRPHVAIVDIGEGSGAISDSAGASLVGAGMISVLLYPLLAIKIAGSREAEEISASIAGEEPEY